MFDRQLREQKDLWLRQLVKFFCVLHPNLITGLSLVFGIAAAGLAAQGHFYLGLCCFLFGRILDGLDGAVARHTGRQTDLGGYLDLMADFLIYALIPIGIWWSLRLPQTEIALIAMLAIFYLNAASWMLLSALTVKSSSSTAIKDADDQSASLTSLPMPSALIEGFETIVFYCLFFLLPAAQFWLFSAFSLLVAISIWQRLAWAIKYLH